MGMFSAALFSYVLWTAPTGPLAAFPPVSSDQLKQSGLPADGPSLLAYLRSRILVPGDAEALAARVKQLDDRSFAVRENATKALIAAGPKATPFLRGALNDSDAEVRRRAQSCLQALERQMGILPLAVQRLVQERPGQEIPVLLGLASIADEPLAEVVLSALAILSIQREPDAAIFDALRSHDAAQRVAAVWTLGRCGAKFRPQVQPLLQDKEARVRYAAALALLGHGDASAASTLAGLLDDADRKLARQAESVLVSLADDGGPPLTANAAAAARRQAWDGWRRLNPQALNLAHVDDWLPPTNMPQRVRVFARRAFEAMRAADIAAMRSNVTAAFLYGVWQYPSEDWLDSRAWTTDSAPLYFRGLRVYSTAQYLQWARTHQEIEFAEQNKVAWAVVYAPDRHTWGVMLILPDKERLKLAGISIDRVGAPR